MITKPEMIAEIRARLQASGTTLKAFAKAHGVADTYLGDILRGKQKPSPNVLRRFGFERVEIYRRVQR